MIFLNKPALTLVWLTVLFLTFACGNRKPLSNPVVIESDPSLGTTSTSNSTDTVVTVDPPPTTLVATALRAVQISTEIEEKVCSVFSVVSTDSTGAPAPVALLTLVEVLFSSGTIAKVYESQNCSGPETFTVRLTPASAETRFSVRISSTGSTSMTLLTQAGLFPISLNMNVKSRPNLGGSLYWTINGAAINPSIIPIIDLRLNPLPFLVANYELTKLDGSPLDSLTFAKYSCYVYDDLIGYANRVYLDSTADAIAIDYAPFANRGGYTFELDCEDNKFHSYISVGFTK